VRLEILEVLVQQETLEQQVQLVIQEILGIVVQLETLARLEQLAQRVILEQQGQQDTGMTDQKARITDIV
jgi:hypothetical protein